MTENRLTTVELFQCLGIIAELNVEVILLVIEKCPELISEGWENLCTKKPELYELAKKLALS